MLSGVTVLKGVRNRPLAVLVVSTVAMAALLTSACSGKADAPAASATVAAAKTTAAVATTAAATAAATTPAATATPAATTIRVGTSGGGLVDSKGMTLYVFKNDVAGSGKSACNAACATNWPALKATAGTPPSKGTGIAGDLSVVTRDDGTQQVAYKGLPLYYFAADQAVGEAKGAAINNWGIALP